MNLKGTHTLSLGVVGQDVTKPVVQLGIKGRSEDGWYHCLCPDQGTGTARNVSRINQWHAGYVTMSGGPLAP